jgi:hypothetical protein
MKWARLLFLRFTGAATMSALGRLPTLTGVMPARATRATKRPASYDSANLEMQLLMLAIAMPGTRARDGRLQEWGELRVIAQHDVQGQ